MADNPPPNPTSTPGTTTVFGLPDSKLQTSYVGSRFGVPAPPPGPPPPPPPPPPPVPAMFSVLVPPDSYTSTFEGSLHVDLGPGTGFRVEQLVGSAPGDGRFTGRVEEADTEAGPWNLVIGGTFTEVTGGDVDQELSLTTVRRWVRYAATFDGDSPIFSLCAVLLKP